MTKRSANFAAAPLPSAWYVEPDAFVRERRAIFAQAWQMIARSEALARAGDYVCHNLAGLAVFVMRDEAGHIGAHLNVCRHQGLPVLDSGPGSVPQLRCRYHGWTYNLDGSFKEAPLKYEPADPTRPEHRLGSVPLLAWRGLLFVSPEGKPADFAASIAPLDAALGPAATALPLAAEIATDIGCNWKLLAEHWLAQAQRRRLWHFPTLALEPGEDSLVVQQVIPRTHARTRVVSHVLAADAALAEQVKSALAVDKVQAEALQAAATRGEEAAPAAEGSALAAFRARIAAAQDRG
ncbi:MAG TPA: aromatic ring-hydroxylating dioxygenase subunit alpha [Alphaproteobacteria bacterium]|nr:aromatic ring-hydroxylating dioxygenase subunit alpha [Alphaproteobacteria bacterium]